MSDHETASFFRRVKKGLEDSIAYSRGQLSLRTTGAVGIGSVGTGQAALGQVETLVAVVEQHDEIIGVFRRDPERLGFRKVGDAEGHRNAPSHFRVAMRDRG